MATRKVAAFDFDGTLSRGDSLIPFFLQLLGARKLAHSVLVHAKPLVSISVGRGDRDRTKERFIAHALAGKEGASIHALGATFATELLRTRMLAAPMSRLAWHRAQGHELVLVSASLDVYLEPLARELGFTHAITTKLELIDDRATGKLVGGNVRAQAKADLLAPWLGEDVELWAYGNSSGDYEMLRLANHPNWVNRRGDISKWVDPAQ